LRLEKEYDKDEHTKSAEKKKNVKNIWIVNNATDTTLKNYINFNKLGLDFTSHYFYLIFQLIEYPNTCRLFMISLTNILITTHPLCFI